MRGSSRVRTAIVVCLGAAFACNSAIDAPPPTYRGGVMALLRQRCASCHSGTSPAAGYRTTSYLEVIGCTGAGTPATTGKNPPIVAVLDRPNHASLLSTDERALLTQWIDAGAPAIDGAVHAAAFVDPRSPGSHARFLRARRYRPMLQIADAEACGRCHEGAPTRDVPPRAPAPNATACTSCHAEPEGPLACSTCHGDSPRAYPPRDACFFPASPMGPASAPNDAHAAHVSPSTAKASGLACVTCHPTPATGDFTGAHADGATEVWFTTTTGAGAGASFDSTTKACATSCHAGPSAERPTPKWTEGEPMTCTSCHGAPPTPHASGACSSCHVEANATGTALIATKLHLDGLVEVGDGSGKCGACHGTGDDPWPKTGAHAAHASPSRAAPVACGTCHDVPTSFGPGTGHPRDTGTPIVTLTGLAAHGGLAPKYDSATKTCANVYCHAGPGGKTPTPTWTAGATASTCGACHSIPPPAPHTSGISCGVGTCHGGSVDSGTFTRKGIAKHVDGVIELAIP